MTEKIGVSLTITDKFRREYPTEVIGKWRNHIIKDLLSYGFVVESERHRDVALRADEYHFCLRKKGETLGDKDKLEKMRESSRPFSEYGVNVKWETTNARRGQEAPLLKEGWEPFAVVQHDGIDYLYLRRKIE